MAGFLSRLFGWGNPDTRKEIERGAFWCVPGVSGLAAGRGFNQPVVGESFYQDALKKEAGGKAKYQVNIYRPVELREAEWKGAPCIHVLIAGKRCGSLPSGDADALLDELRPIAASGLPVIAKGRIMGGFEGGSFGLVLSLSRPLKVRKD